MSKISRSTKSKDDQIKQTDLEFNINISSVRTRKDLLEVFDKTLSKLIQFDDVSISLTDHEKGTYKSFIYYSKVGRERRENFFKISTSAYNLQDNFYKVTSESAYPTVWNLKEVMQWKTIPEYLVCFSKYGVKKILGVALQSAEANLGCLFFLSEEEDAFSPEAIIAVEEVAGQISIALINILFVEEIEKREREKDILLDLITTIASIRDRADLDRVIEDQLKKAFSFNDLAIPIINSDRLTHRLYIRHYEKERKTSKEHTFTMDLGRCSIHDGILDAVINSHYPIVWDIDEVSRWKNVPAYVKFWSNNQMKKMVGVPIKSKGESVGAILFFSENPGSFQAEDLHQINAIANQLSVAVLNILTNEEMQKREHEKEILLSLSNDIAAIRNKKELLTVIKEKLKALLPFNDIVISVPNDDRRYHHTFIHNYEPKRNRHPDFERLIELLYPLDDGVLDVTMRAPEPVNFVIEELMQNNFVPEYITYYHQTGIKEIVGVAMRNGREDVGALFLSSEQSNGFSKQHLSLIKSISSQLSIVMSNIVANEMIIAKEKEVSVLLTFSNEISTVRDKNQLLAILNNNIRKLIPFTRIAIILYDNEDKRHYNFLSTVSIPLGDDLLNQTRVSHSPVVFSIGELHENDLLEIVETDQKEFIGVSMHNGGRVLGALYLFAEEQGTFQQKDYNLLQGIADQLSFTVINILANENIVKRETEKTILLEMSKDMAKVRNKFDLHRIVDEKLKKLLPYSHSITIKVDEDGKNASVFLESQDTRQISNPELAEIMNNPIPVHDGILDFVLSVEHPVIFDLTELVKRADAPRYLTLNYELGIAEIVVTPFSDSNGNTGFLVIFAKDRHLIDNNHLNLVQGMSSQLSIAMSNIIANEKIEKQILEISSFKQQLEVENLYLQEEIHTTHNYSEIIGISKEMNEVFHLISQVSQTQSSVLLLGETGTGKELIARAIHNSSLRKNKLMVKVNCATLPANLIESELFGHERGSFTGATDRRIGKFELANNSTLFLDEIGELPLDLQVKLLRALQEKEIERLGGRSVIKTDVRVIAATNRNLAKEVQAGNFRSDLFFRLNVFPITIPPLRDRRDDIPILAAHFLEKLSKKLSKKIIGFSNNAIRELMAYDWPGNVRELEHLIERTILLTSQPTINHLHLPLADADEKAEGQHHSRFKTIDEVEREHIMAVLKSCNGKVAGIGGAAEVLRIPTTTLHSKMKRLGIGKKFSGN